VHAVNGFGLGPDAASAPVRVDGAPVTYLSSILADAPSLLWRYGERSGARIADSSGHGRDGRYVLDNFVNDGVLLNRPSALANDPDTAFGKADTYHYYGATFARALKADGLPGGNTERTVECWLRFSNTVVLASYGGFAVTATSRALSVSGAGGGVSIPVADLSLTDGRWHHVAVTYDGARFTGYVDGGRVGSADAPAAMTTTTAGGLEAGAIPTGQSSGYFDELAIYPSALGAARVRAHFDDSGNSLPSPPPDLQVAATAAQPNRISVSWSPSTGGAPPDQRVVESYVVTAYTGAQVRGSKSVSGAVSQAVLTGLPGDRDYTVKVHATNGFGAGADATSATVRVAGAHETYASAVIADDPALYWRYNEPSGALIGDSSRHRHDGYYVLDNFVNNGVDLNRPGALADGDTAFGKGQTYHYYGATFARALKAEGLPAGNAERTVEGWVKFSSAVVIASYGGFAVTAGPRTITISTGTVGLSVGTGS
ncbi:MAG: LamG-like jellyroll fold domain-containing protein, partial [Solirubrobacteraceae bacterium]